MKMYFSEYFNWSYVLWPLAIYGGLSLANRFIVSSFLSLINTFFDNQGSAKNGEQRSLLDDGSVITHNRMFISVVCANQSKTGRHAFLLFEMKRHRDNSALYYRADFGPENAEGAELLSKLSSGNAKIKVERTQKMALVRNWLIGGGIYQKFPYQYQSEPEVIEQIESLAEQSDEFVYSLSGDHSSASVNSKENNQNCATWCALVLQESFDIDIHLQDEKWAIIRSPNLVVRAAQRFHLN